jgi:hypothetical protein
MDQGKKERHIAHLQKIHNELDEEIQRQYDRYGDDNLVKVLKKKKLQLKDEIERTLKYADSTDY